MAIRTDGNAPYCPPKTLMDIVHRFRDRGLATPFTLEVLTRAGISDGLAPRVLQSLRLLDLIDEAGNPTAAFEGLRRASTAEFPQLLEQVLREAYSEVFNFVDPTQDGAEDIADAFRSYRPAGQRARMVTLFLGLCREAGIIETTPNRPRTSNGSSPSQRPSRARARQQTPSRRPPKPKRGEIPPQVMSLLDTLPAVGETWSKERRDQFIRAFEAVLDYTFPVGRQAIGELGTGSDDQD